MAELLLEIPPTDEQCRCVATIRSNGEALLNLITEILDPAKIESGRMAIESLGFDLAEDLDQSAETMAICAHEKSLELAVRIAPEAPLIWSGDPPGLRQIIMDLVSNGAKLTDPGEQLPGVERTAAHHRPPACSAHGGGDRWVGLGFSVADTGSGRPRDGGGDSFSDCGQVDRLTTRIYGGRGPGLTIVKRLVKLQGGKVTVHRALSGRSCFSFTVAVAARTQPLVEELTGWRLLVVDERVRNRLLIKEILASISARTGAAQSDRQGLAEPGSARQAGQAYQLLRVRERDRARHRYPPAVLRLTSDDLTQRRTRSCKISTASHQVEPIRHHEGLITMARAGGVGDALTNRPPACADKAAYQLPPLRILLADDSEDNRLLLRGYLKHTPFQLDEAEDGEVAQDMFKRNSYDLLLMDMQMPVMDGYAATRAIRSWEQASRLNPTQIIALTASALNEDVARCLEAGCDLHLSKPVRRQPLFEAITRTVGSHGLHGGGYRENFIARVDRELQDLVPSFLALKRVDIKTALSALQRGEYEVAARVGHQLKGEGGAYGFDGVSEMGGELELAATCQDRQAAFRWAAQLAEFLEQVEVTFAT